MTRAQIRTLLKTLVSEGGTNYFTDAAYNRFIDDAYTEVHLQVNWDWQTSTTSAVASQKEYVFTGFSVIRRVDYDDRMMEPVTAEWLWHQDREFQTKTGRPQFFYLGADENWGYADDDTEEQVVSLYPIPDGTDTIRVMGLASPDALAADGTTPNLPHWCHRAIAYEAAAMVLESQGEQRAESLGQMYRIISKWFIDQAHAVRADRHQHQKVHSIGGSADVPRRLRRNTSINGTGLTGL